MREAVDERGAQDADHGIAGERAGSEPPDLERRRVELEDSESRKREPSELCSDCAHCLAEPKAIEVSSNSEGQSGCRPLALFDVATEPRGGGPPRSVSRATHVRRICALESDRSSQGSRDATVRNCQETRGGSRLMARGFHGLKPWRAHRIRKITEVARSAAIAMLNARAARSECNRRWSTAPNTSHRRKHGTVIAANVMPSSRDRATALPAAGSTNVAAAAAHISQAFGLIHWNAAIAQNPGELSCALTRCPAVAVLQASQRRKAAPHTRTTVTRSGLSRITVPRPNVTTAINVAMPALAPTTAGRPCSSPRCAPVVASSVLLGPGVAAAATVKAMNATSCCVINRTPRAAARTRR